MCETRIRVEADSVQRPERAPSSCVLFTVDEVARAAQVPKAVVVRLCIEGAMPPWIEEGGRRYWDVKVVGRAVGAAPGAGARDRRFAA